ncbi:F-box/LRR-repeat protein At3g58930-like [Papaver somniferum]|uniref:F-box/LRR-repeat protein At3g58930-like n=1 Tax=Papaver somniferum TaxID=3469 RepID=UPI000E6F49FC|nr:F-box/LRR-repeat protein At3g58930-like [Papaver somniferum]
MYIWKSLPTLNIGSEVHWLTSREIGQPGDGLIPFVDKVFSQRDRSDIQRFQIHCSDMHINISSDHIYRWIASAVSLNVQELRITIEAIDVRGDFEFPSCLATCKSLSELELVFITCRYCGDRKKIILPVSISLPRMKSLRLTLRSLVFDDENLANKFFSSCPALESLKMFCQFSNMKPIVSFPQLKRFGYYEIGNNDSIQLCAPNLTCLRFHGCISSDYSMENLASLTSADIFMFINNNEDGIRGKQWKISAQKKRLYANKMMKLLRGLYNVKDLRLSEYILKVLQLPSVLCSMINALVVSYIL